MSLVDGGGAFCEHPTNNSNNIASASCADFTIQGRYATGTSRQSPNTPDRHLVVRERSLFGCEVFISSRPPNINSPSDPVRYNFSPEVVFAR